MADVTVNSAALDKLSTALEGQTVALKGLTDQNKREILQKDQGVNIKGVQTGSGGVRPYDETITNAVAAGNQPLVDAMQAQEAKPGILKTILKGVLVGGAAYLIFQAIQKSPAVKKIFDAGVAAVKNFLVGDSGILTKIYDFLFKDGEGKDAGLIRRMVRSMKDLFNDVPFLDKLVTGLATAIQGVGTFFEQLFGEGAPENEGLFRRILRIMKNTFKQDSVLDKVAESIANGIDSVHSFFTKVFNFFTGKDLPPEDQDLPFTTRVYNEAKKLFDRAFIFVNDKLRLAFNMFVDNTFIPKFNEVLFGKEGKGGLINNLKAEIPGIVAIIKNELPGLRKKLKEQFDIFIDDMYVKLRDKINQLIDDLGLRGIINTAGKVKQKAQELKNTAEIYANELKPTNMFRGSAIGKAHDAATDKLADGLNWIMGRQQGGSVRAGGMYTVGEGGPETFVPGSPGTILPNIVKPIQKLGDVIVDELRDGNISTGISRLGDKMDNLAATIAGAPGTVVQQETSPMGGENYNNALEQRMIARV